MKTNMKIHRRALRLLLVFAAIAACLVITACGSSSTSSSSTTSTSASAATSKGSTTSRTSLEECLKKHGLTPPAHTPGSGTGTRPTGTPPAGAGGGTGNPTLQAAFKACGASGHFAGASGTATSSS